MEYELSVFRSLGSTDRPSFFSVVKTLPRLLVSRISFFLVYKFLKDVWSAACVAFEFFGNRVLFKGKDAKDQITLITGVLGYPTDEDIKSIGVRRPRIVRKEARGIETVGCFASI